MPIKAGMKSELRLRYLLPLVVVAAVGLAVFKLGLFGGNSQAEASNTLIPPAAAGTSSTTETGATNAGATETDGTGTQPAAGETSEQTPHAATAKGPTGLESLATALKKNAVVVVVVYSPVGAVDNLEISEARLGADDAGAGFLALDASKEHAIADFAETYDVRLTPTVLVFRRGPELVKKFIEFADRDTVAQAAHDAKHTS
jgi:hypothetical protein